MIHDITLNDSTQNHIIKHLQTTLRLISQAASLVSGSEQSAEIWAMPDLGLPHNVQRILGGFYTGACYAWKSRVPLVPVDTTVNCCGVSVFKVNETISSQEAFDSLIEKATRQVEDDSSYMWNFLSGNHFIIFGEVRTSDVIPKGNYLVLHSSASEFKKQHNGLYPTKDNWYYHQIKTIRDSDTDRGLRYIDGRTAERFVEIAHMLESYNAIRHRYFAEVICGARNIESELLNEQHYGMPTESSVAIGCQWFSKMKTFLFLTAPERPLFFVTPSEGGKNQIVLDDRKFVLLPHGLGKCSTSDLNIKYLPHGLEINNRVYSVTDSLQDVSDLQLRNFEVNSPEHDPIPDLLSKILDLCPGKVVARLHPLFSYYRGMSRFKQHDHSQEQIH